MLNSWMHSYNLYRSSIVGQKATEYRYKSSGPTEILDDKRTGYPLILVLLGLSKHMLFV